MRVLGLDNSSVAMMSTLRPSDGGGSRSSEQHDMAWLALSREEEGDLMMVPWCVQLGAQFHWLL